MERNMTHDMEITTSSGNVFADLGLANPDERALKSQLAILIRMLIEQKGWTQAQAAEVIGIDQPKVSHLLRGRLAGFSTDRLLTVVNRLGHNVEIHISREEYPPEDTHLFVSLG